MSKAPRDRRSPGIALSGTTAALSGVGAALLSAASTACCTGPAIAVIVVSVLGAGGAAWAAGLKPYSPYLLAGSLLLIGFGFWRTRRPTSCRLEQRRSVLWIRRLARGTLWLAGLVWVLSATLELHTWL